MLVERHHVGEGLADALADPAGGLGLGVPYRGEHGEHVGAADAVGLHPPQRRSVAAQRVEPFAGVVIVAPAGSVHGVHCDGGFPERRHLRASGGGVITACYVGPQFGELAAGLGQRDGRVAAYADVALLAVDGEPNDPRAAPVGLHDER